jgi:chaperonin cofactor prefoldin
MRTIGRFHARMGALLLAGAAASHAQEPAQPNLQSSRDTVAKWVETQQILAREKKDWQDGKEILERRVELLESEIRSLETKLEESRSTLGEADRRRYEVVSEGESLRVATAALAERVERLEGKVRTLLSRSPEPLRNRVAPLSQRLPAPGTATTLSLGERYQNAIGVLNEVNKFQRDVTVASEIRTLSDGARVEVQALYLGLAQGYYVTADGSAAGVGVPTDEGWDWTQSNDLAPAVQQAISILQNESVPAYVPLPVTLR